MGPKPKPGDGLVPKPGKNGTRHGYGLVFTESKLRFLDPSNLLAMPSSWHQRLWWLILECSASPDRFPLNFGTLLEGLVFAWPSGLSCTMHL